MILLYTKGLGFWKCARRQISAVLKDEDSHTTDSSNDDDDYVPGDLAEKGKIRNSDDCNPTFK